jgi:hypothetical protein
MYQLHDTHLNFQITFVKNHGFSNENIVTCFQSNYQITIFEPKITQIEEIFIHYTTSPHKKKDCERFFLMLTDCFSLGKSFFQKSMIFLNKVIF